MVRTMHDSVDADAIPVDAEMVAGYVDGRYAWSKADWDRFPDAVKVRISAVGDNVNAHVFDVEVGCIWPPAEVVGLVVQARALGIDPTVYVNERNDWGPTRAAFDAAGVAHPHWWVANYDGRTTPPAGAVAKQYANPEMPQTSGHYDLSVVADFWPGVDGSFDNPSRNTEGWLMALTDAEQQELLDKVRMIYSAHWETEKAPTVGGGPGTPETVQDTVQRVAALVQTTHDSLYGHLANQAYAVTAHDDLAQRITAD